jgi:hypothetical protein
MTTQVRCARRPEQGYALMMVIFMVGLMILATAAAIPDILTQGRRQREQEMIWRGEQYERGVKLYFKKKGKFPTSLDDITKEQDGIHFMRQIYKDPMNTEDGSWRLIYVTPAGQLIGSLNYQTLQQMATVLRPNAPGAGGTAPGALPGQPGGPGPVGNSGPLGAPGGNPQTGGYGNGQQGSGTQGTSENGTGGNGPPGAPGTTENGTTSGGTGTGTDSNTDEDSNTGPVLGGSIVGVASKVNKPSLKVYQKAVKYKKWEFIWNPLLEAAGGAGGAGSGGTQGAGGAPGASGTGQPGTGQPGNGQNPGFGGNPPQGAAPNAPTQSPGPGSGQ